MSSAISRTAAVASLLLPLASNAAVYKCQNGSAVTYQDRPCAGASSSESEVKVRSNGPRHAQSDQPTEDHTISEWLAKSEKEDRRRELELKITKLEKQNHAYDVDRDSKLAKLQKQKLYAANHVAGSGNESMISRQMDRISVGYDQKMRQNQGQIDAMKKQLDRAP